MRSFAFCCVLLTGLYCHSALGDKKITIATDGEPHLYWANKDCGTMRLQSSPEVTKARVLAATAGVKHYPHRTRFFLKQKERSDKADYKTPGANVLIEIPPGMAIDKAAALDILDENFSHKVRQIGYEDFSSELMLQAGLRETSVREDVQKLEKMIFQPTANYGREKDFVRLFLYFFPSMRERIINAEDPELAYWRPFLCYHEQQHAKEKRLKKWSKLFSGVAGTFAVMAFIVPPLAAIPLIVFPIVIAVNLAADTFNITIYLKGMKKKMMGLKLANAAINIENKMRKLYTERLAAQKITPGTAENKIEGTDKPQVVDITEEELVSLWSEERKESKETKGKKEVTPTAQRVSEYKNIRAKGHNLYIRLIAKSGKTLLIPFFFVPLVAEGVRAVNSAVQGGQLLSRKVNAHQNQVKKSTKKKDGKGSEPVARPASGQVG